MKVLASNDLVEFLRVGITDSDRPQFMAHQLQVLDLRGEWTLRLLQSWGMAGTMGDILSRYGCSEHQGDVRQVPPEELVMRICEVVDAAWNEMQHRGWIVHTVSMGE